MALTEVVDDERDIRNMNRDSRIDAAQFLLSTPTPTPANKVRAHGLCARRTSASDPLQHSSVLMVAG